MGNIRRRVAAVLLFIDTVRQCVVRGSSLHIQIRQKNQVIWKEDGYVVVMEQPGTDSLDISVSGGGFAGVRLHIDIARENPVRVNYVPLLPSAAYPFTGKMALIHGKVSDVQGISGTMYAVRIADGGRYRLMDGAAVGEKMIKLWGGERLLPGQLLCLECEGCREYVTLLEPDDSTEYGYHISENIRNSYIKGKTKIYSAIMVMPGENNEFWIAYEGVHKDGEKILLIYDTKNEMEIGITEGRETEVDVGG